MREFNTPSPGLDGLNLLVTGGTGSFGKAFIRTVLNGHSPRRVVVFSRDELKQYEMEQDLPPAHRDRVRFFIGDVRDASRLEMAMRDVDIVVHTAALKHVPAAEYNPFECINTNVLGAENVVQAAIRAGVGKVLALSTDKAVNPINLYGASKLASDKIFVAANNLSGSGGCRFSVVRYGNVLGSRGSVVPFFRKLIASGAQSLPITDARMTRFWITLEQGVHFVLSSLAMMEGGEIYVPKIPSMLVADLARVMAPNLPQMSVGIRPGEKLHEAMISVDDARMTIDRGDRYVITPAFAQWRATSLIRPDDTRLPEGFTYSSETNDEWLDPTRLSALLAELYAS
jgi:UDP-N-acetylglucosamine 4,6-dehydratase/5-epimerase